MPTTKPPPIHKLKLCESDRKNLRESGLTDSTIRENRLRTEGGALVFPYLTIDGNSNGFTRKRLHDPRVGKDGKQMRYVQPKGKPCRAYFPASSLARIHDGVDIHVTEGEKKALRLAQEGYAAVGLGGVWSWKVKDKEKLIPDLAAIDWSGRDAYICFDFDAKAKTRREVDLARRRLAKALRAAGAKEIYNVELPPGPNGAKQGVDDYLVSNSPEQFRKLGAQAVEIADDGIQTLRLCDVESECLEWLWSNRLLRGKLNVVYGDPGQGKTFLVLDVLSHTTKGRQFCDGSQCKVGEVLFVTAEDGIADTIRPRAEMLGADLTRFHCLEMVRINGREVFLDLDQHLDCLDRWLEQHPAVSVVALDPLAAFLGKIDAHRNNEVRAILARLAAVALKRNVAIVAIDHLSKAQGKALTRGIGSIAFTAAPRAVWQVVADPDDPDRRLFLPVKMNLAKVDGLAFRITDSGLEWETGKVTVTADEAAATEQGDTPRSEAKEWLTEMLKDGPCPSGKIERQAGKDKICMRTLKYAKKEMGIASKRHDGQWSWIPPSEKVTPSKKEPLPSYPVTPLQKPKKVNAPKTKIVTPLHSYFLKKKEGKGVKKVTNTRG